MTGVEIAMADPNKLYILTNGAFNQIEPSNVNERAFLESLIRADYEKYHSDEALEDLKRLARFLKEDKRLLRNWMVVARWRTATNTNANVSYIARMNEIIQLSYSSKYRMETCD